MLGIVMTRIGVASMALMLLSGAAVAGQGQPQPFKWWQADKYKTELGLTAEQSAQIEEVFQALLPKLSAGKEDLDRLEKRVSDLIADGTTSEADVMKEVERTEAARAELGKTRTLMFFRMHRILTPEQRIKMKELHEQRDRNRRDGRGR